MAKLKRTTSEDIKRRNWTEAERQAVERIAARQAAGDDSGIDFSDIPQVTKDPEQYFERRRELDSAAAARIRSGKAKRVAPGMSAADRAAQLQQESRK